MMEIDPDGALLLAAAIARQWIREQPDDLPHVAAWLGIDAHQLRRTVRAVQAGDGITTCRHCGAPLPVKFGGGRHRIWCSEQCRHRANRKLTR